MIQAVVADPVLSQTNSIIGLIVGGVISGLIFIADQFVAVDPLIPPSIFLNPTFTTCVACGTIMAFVRNSITYNMIFFLQGPLGLDPLQAGTDLIPFGIGIMVGGFVSGGFADRFGIRAMMIIGPLIALADDACLSVMDQHTTVAYVGGILFLTGLGIGLFQSPSVMATMLSVPYEKRGVAAAIGILTMTFCMMVGMVLTFSLVLHSLTAEQLFAIFVNGGGMTAPTTVAGNAVYAASADQALHGVLRALATDFYVVIAACAASSVIALYLPSDLHERLKGSPPGPPGAIMTVQQAGHSKVQESAADSTAGACVCGEALQVEHTAVDVVLCSESQLLKTPGNS